MTTKLLFLPVLLLYSTLSFASHIFGGDLSYRYIGDSTGIDHHYEVTIKLYRDLSGVEQFDTFAVNISSSCYATITLEPKRIIFNDNSDGHGGLILNPSGCVDTTIKPVKSLHLYKGSVILPGKCPDWRFAAKIECCRSSQITNLSEQVGMHLYATLNNTLDGTTNNSIKNNPEAHTANSCQEQHLNLLLLEEDEDRDSVYFELTYSLDSDMDTIYLRSGHSMNEPLISENGIVLDQENQTISFTPDRFRSQYATIALLVTEYRYNSAAQQHYIIGKKHSEITILTRPCPRSLLHWNITNFNLDSLSGSKCLDEWIHFYTPGEFMGSSLVSTDFDIVSKDSTSYPIVDAISDNPDGYASRISLHLAEPFTKNDTLYVYAKKGEDGNTIINKCGIEMFETHPPYRGYYYAHKILIDNCYISLSENEITAFDIYPNPANDILYFQSKEDKKEKTLYFQILDYSGKLIKELSYNIKGKDAVPISINELPPGLYFIRIDEKGQKSYFSQFIKN